MEGYCEPCGRWFDIDPPGADAGYLCPRCLTQAGAVRAKARIAHRSRRPSLLRRSVPPAEPAQETR